MSYQVQRLGFLTEIIYSQKTTCKSDNLLNYRKRKDCLIQSFWKEMVSHNLKSLINYCITGIYRGADAVVAGEEGFPNCD